MTLTKEQQATLDFIILFQEKNSVSPTTREIAIHFHVAINAIFKRLQSLKQKGLLKYYKKRMCML